MMTAIARSLAVGAAMFAADIDRAAGKFVPPDSALPAARPVREIMVV
ncbi:MAG TPA: hypothetical protein VJY33_02010 [Isosphaeraceae bacterium]|nr:hypothetical protein [Isosphaeraceae bacterium]